MKILVTGANGQLGTELHNVLELTHPGLTTYTDVDTLDITNQDALKSFISKGEFTHIVNCAAYTAVDKAETEPAICNKINIDAVRNIAIAASDCGAKVIHISTDYVFDGKAYKPYRESDKVNPVSTYGTSKRKGEMMLLSMCQDCIILRTAWLYSPYGNNFVKTMLRLGDEKPLLNVVYDQVGTPTYAHDLAEAVTTILFARQWISGIYHFSNEGVCSWYDFTKAIFREANITGCKVNAILSEDYPTAAPRPHYSVLDKTLIKKTYGISIPNWEDSLRQCIGRIQSSSENS
ncbi:MAG: dTDP-4-dehydrorhamnose reductase [Firmicutes bacterium]|nr:dTDP-4-dehydrorhamnose reductase [Bacillota bacterium]MCM1401404.1 dTDP-4-dehydrorhamnose reductase [Bacteroides sp.]MCM1477326.1 dTDP-4-dehydrorhamnose reductase [Bacteroides sp.]